MRYTKYNTHMNSPTTQFETMEKQMAGITVPLNISTQEAKRWIAHDYITHLKGW